MVVAIPYFKEGYLNFWKIVKMDSKLYSEAYMRNSDIIKLDDIYDKEGLLKHWKKLLLEKQRELDSLSKAKAMVRTIGSAKQYQKTILKSLNEKIIGTTVL